MLDHGVAATLDAGDLHLRDQPVMTVPDIFGEDGILGYDVFATAVVHIDFRSRRVDLEPRDGFAPPPDATPLTATFDEGIAGWNGSAAREPPPGGDRSLPSRRAFPT